jgi:hypothetical protein
MKNEIDWVMTRKLNSKTMLKHEANKNNSILDGSREPE